MLCCQVSTGGQDMDAARVTWFHPDTTAAMRQMWHQAKTSDGGRNVYYLPLDAAESLHTGPLKWIHW